LALTAVAVVVAVVAQRRRPDPPSAPSFRAPAQLDRDDFADPDTRYLAVVFASKTCNTCPEVWDQVAPLAAPDLAVQRIDVEDDPDLHRRYRIDGVPTTVMATADGVVMATYFGPLDLDDVEEGLSMLRELPEND
jgi:hypothetical protein